MKKFKFLLIAALLAFIAASIKHNSELIEKNKILSNNIEVLHDSITRYKITDSLNAITIAELRLSKKEFAKYRSEDKKLIDELTKKLELFSTKKLNLVSKDTIKIELHDTILIDSVKYFKYRSRWSHVDGIIYADSVELNIQNKEELIIAESFEKKRFLGIRLPVRLFGYRNKRMDVVSKNPNTQIQSVDYVNIR